MTTPFHQRLKAHSSTPVGPHPFITIAIPHYRHRRYLEVVLDSIFAQDFDQLEIVVSDDQSPDDSSTVIPDVLQRAKRPFRYYVQPANLGYDGSVRFCLAAAQGRYVMLLGNDDALAGPQTIREIVDALTALNHPAVAFTNYCDYASGEVMQRALRTQVLGAGPRTAVQFFRSFSFVAGLLFDQEATQQHETDRWDQSVYNAIGCIQNWLTPDPFARLRAGSSGIRCRPRIAVGSRKPEGSQPILNTPNAVRLFLGRPCRWSLALHG